MSDGSSSRNLLEQLEKDRLITTAWITQEVTQRLKSPLSVAKSRLEALVSQLEYSAKQNAQSILDQITEAEKTLGSIETFLLDFNGSTKTIVKPQSVFEDIILFFQLRLSQSGIGILNMVPEALEIELKAQAFQQIFLSLFINSLEAIESSGKRDKYIHFHYQMESKFHVFSIEDDGPGMPAEIFSSLFRPFYSSKEGHVGIGLATCKKMAEQQGWQFSITSRTNRGTRATLKIPQSAGSGS